MLNLNNFVRTTLRAPLQPTDNVLQLALGAGTQFSFPVGDHCYITLEDRLTSEVVRYTSIGTVLLDNIIVARAQDNTFATAFPAGTCVKVAWNKQQVKELIAETFATLSTIGCPPTNTVVVASAPVSAPSGCVKYALVSSTTPWSMYYWTGAIWQKIGDAGAYTSSPPILISASKVVSLQFGDGLKVGVNGLTLKLALNSGLAINSAGELTIDCSALGTACPALLT